MTGNRRRFGSIRKRSSGRYQVRYPGPDGLPRAAPDTFARKSDAERYLALVEAQLLRDEWVDPARASIELGDYASQWISQRAGLRPRTVQLYTWTLAKHITPYLGRVPLSRIDTAMVREWRTKLLDSGVSVSLTAKAYRLLRAIFMTAVRDDEIVRRNPCRIKGADKEHAAERPVLSVEQVISLADLVPSRYRALILVSAFGCLRWGEVTALQRKDIDIAKRTIRVRQAITEIRGVGLVVGTPKSRAGRRVVALPPAVMADVEQHLTEFVGPNPDSYVFTGLKGNLLWRGTFNKLVDWMKVVADLGMPGLHFHDLRHTGNTLAAATGATLRDLMTRMGQDSSSAALIYLHGSSTADQAIATALNVGIEAARAKAESARKDAGDDVVEST